jgi:16S rRNA (guanine1207-N2)-methyltransferase
MRKSKKHIKSFAELLQPVATKLRPPFGVILGSPAGVAELVQTLPEGELTCYQMDLYQADRLRDQVKQLTRPTVVETRPDLWDLPADFQTLLYPVPQGGERALKIDMIEQAFHVLKPQGTLIVLSPYDKDDFFPAALKKVFGRVHTPMEGDNHVFWCQRNGDRPRRRHEMTYHVRVDEATSYAFVSRPGVFGYGFYDGGARALVEATELVEGQRVLDLGCGVGTNGILAARKVGPSGSVVFADSNVRAIALAELNATTIGVLNYEALLSHTVTELPDASFDAVLANPPYYAQGTIIRLFVERSRSLLRPGGVLYLVTKQVDATWPMVKEFFPEPEMYENRGYVIFRATKPAS